jgi:hypothetical protein
VNLLRKIGLHLNYHRSLEQQIALLKESVQLLEEIESQKDLIIESQADHINALVRSYSDLGQG